MDNDGFTLTADDVASYGRNGHADTEEAAICLAEQLEDDYQARAVELAGGSNVFSDLLQSQLATVNWREIAQHYVDAALEVAS